ncbi:hypothetical protein [Natronosalvus vescus]|uniref:hypothetical protein n=1 Tax=Natronosalvus vescus TaxID=2953881 RepID=UPI0020903E24|nr:hypothetical protein [Natronosalvus vescus]
MDVPHTVKWGLVHRTVAIGSFLLGGLLVVIGFLAGFWGSIGVLVSDPLDPRPAIDASRPMVTVAFALLGIAVWQFGKSIALFHTLPRAAGREAARQFDHQTLKSDVLQALDGRLTDMEEDIAETRRSVQELKRAEHAAAFDEQSVLEDSSETPALEGSSTASNRRGPSGTDSQTSSGSRETTSGRSSQSQSSTQSQPSAPSDDDRSDPLDE